MVTKRPRLVDREIAGMMTVIVGPSGTGKTVLAGQLADRVGARLAWCRFAPGWEQPSDLIAMIGASLGLELEAEGEDLLEAAGQILGVLEDEPTTLVVDDLHECNGTEAERLLAEVAAFLPDNSSIVVTSRARPTELIGLAGPVTVIDSSELAFTAAETAELFTGRGLEARDGEQALATTRGWAAALVASAETGGDPALGSATLIASVLSTARLGPLRPLAEAAAVLPYLSAGIAQTLGLGSSTDLERLGEQTTLVSRAGDQWRLHQAASELVINELEAQEVTALRAAAAPLMSKQGDFITAIELYIAAGEPEAAAELLASRASEIGPARATRWLYQLPDDVRRRLPPVLTSGRATVNVSLAIEMARKQVEQATDGRSRRELLLGLGSLEMAEGEPGIAADSFEQALRLAVDDRPFQTVVNLQLGLARWFAGDTSGAAAAVGDLDNDPWARWLQAAMALTTEDLDVVRLHAHEAVRLADGIDVTEAPGRAMLAAAALVESGPNAALRESAAAYELALGVGGRDLSAAGPIHAWIVLRSGDRDAAQAVTEQVERVIGRQDHFARFQCALVRRGMAQTFSGAQLADRQRAERRVLDLRTHGYGAVEKIAAVLAGQSGQGVSAAGLRVQFCGNFKISVDGSAIDSGSWKSKKAMEVCVYLSQAGSSGLRREQVIEAIWQGRDPDKGRTLLRTALSEVRRVLEPRRGAGQESRFVTTAGDRVSVIGTSDLGEASGLRAAGNDSGAFDLLAAGLAPDLPAAEWMEEIAHATEVQMVEIASRVTDLSQPAELVTRAFEVLISAEPWQRDHFTGLASFYRSTGDELAAADVERRWFADD